ncbi:MAG: methyl-accepting chemotaxis protein [Motiliproteus sp.]
MLLAMGSIGVYFTQEQERSILQQNERAMIKLSETTSQSVQTIMLAGYADIAEDLAANLKKVDGVSDFRIVDRYGMEAFTKNTTIEEVNERIGDEEFFTRDEERQITVLDKANQHFQQAIDTLQTVTYYEQGHDGEPLLTLLTPVENHKDCSRCHGSDHKVRGVIKITSPLTDIYAEIRHTWISLVVAMMVITLLVIIIIGWLVRRISLPILNVANQMDAISTGDGDLTVSLPVNGQDEVAKLSNGFNTFVRKIHATMANVAESGSRLNKLADGVKNISSETLRATSQQRQDTEHAAQSVAAMQTTVMEVSEHASSAMTEARQVESIAQQGRGDVEGTINSIRILKHSIDDSSRAISNLGDDVEKIGDILVMIQSIANQTNLLALNASIEAARAGENGRGFAVVADEVRTLAGRTQQSTSDIQSFIERLQLSSGEATSLMDTCQRQADSSMDQADRSGVSLKQITEAAHEIVNINTTISTALAESERSTEEINRSISSINQEAQHTNQQADQAYHRSIELAGVVEHLEQLVKQFRR